MTQGQAQAWNAPDYLRTSTTTIRKNLLFISCLLITAFWKSKCINLCPYYCLTTRWRGKLCVLMKAWGRNPQQFNPNTVQMNRSGKNSKSKDHLLVKVYFFDILFRGFWCCSYWSFTPGICGTLFIWVDVWADTYLCLNTLWCSLLALGRSIPPDRAIGTCSGAL